MVNKKVFMLAILISLFYLGFVSAERPNLILEGPASIDTNETDPIYSAWDKDYNDLTNTPSFLSYFNDDILWTSIFNSTGDSKWLDDTTRSDGEILGVCSVYNETDWVLAQNYLTSYSEADPVFTSENFSLWSAINNRLLLTDQRFNETDLITPHTIDTNRSDLEINSLIDNRVVQSFIEALGFVTGEHTVDTTRNDSDILGVCSIYNETGWVLSQNYLTSYSETDPIFISENASLWSSINNKLDINDGRYNDTSWVLSQNYLTEVETNIFFAYDSIGGMVIDGTMKTLIFDTAVVSDSAYTLSGENITINNNGLYRVTLDFGYERTSQSGGARGSVEVRVQEDTGSGMVDIPYALSGSYHRESSDLFSNSQTWVRNFSLGDELRVRFYRQYGTTAINTRAGSSRINIELIR